MLIIEAGCVFVGGVVLVKSILELRIGTRSKNFVERTANLVEAEVINDDGYSVRLSYSYSFDGDSYAFFQNAGDRYGNESIFLRSSAQERAARLLKEGSPITVYVDPTKPGIARRRVGIDPLAIAGTVFGGLFFLVGLRLLIFDYLLCC